MNLRSFIIGLSSLLLLAVFLAGGLRAQQSGVVVKDEAPLEAMRDRALMTMTGNRSDIRKEAYHLVRTPEQFEKLWLAHKGAGVNRATQGWPMPPKLDFDRVQALLLFGGDRHNCNGYSVVKILEGPKQIRIQVDLITYQLDLGSSQGAPRFLDPWALMVLPTSPKTVVVEENRQGLKDHPAKWNQLAAFPGQKGVGSVVPGTSQRQSSD